MTSRPTTFVVTLRTLIGVDGPRALRGVLKVALRRFGLRCLDAHEISTGVALDLPTRKPERSSDE